MKTRTKGTLRLSPNGNKKNKAREAAAAAIDGIVLKVKAEKLTPLEQQLESGELPVEDFQEGIVEIQRTIVQMVAEMQLVTDKMDENAKTQEKNLANLKISMSDIIEDCRSNYE